ncbi:response regulator [Prosthecobacter sp.]|uniref:response regulator n=1 Tax=Prosthecobacter sp. TaxID=1965333 RepID=UPI0025D9EC71|nr:response regulator [Prosthecobacter sp.]
MSRSDQANCGLLRGKSVSAAAGSRDKFLTRSLPSKQATATIRLNMANIIVIEDHQPVLKLISTLCQSDGHDVMAFDNGRAGLEAIREMTPELALVDRRLGDIDGLDMIREAREASPATRFVMVSACSETRDIVTAVRRGVCDYVTKPFEPEELKSAVSRALSEPVDPPPASRQKLIILCPKKAA